MPKRLNKSGKNDRMFLGIGWAEHYQTEGEGSQTILSGKACVRISRNFPVSALTVTSGDAWEFFCSSVALLTFR